MATRNSISNGAWDSAGTWDTGVPGAGDTAVITHNVYIDSDVTVGTNTSGATQYAITINSGGVLRWANPPSNDWTLTLQGGIRVNLGGTLQIGTQASPIPSTRKATVLFSASADNTYWRIYAYGGVVDMHGASAYHMGSASMQRAKLASNVSAGAGVAFTLDRDVDWQVGDFIGFGIGGDKTYTMNPTTWRPERIQITGKTDARNFTATFAYLHRIGDHAISLERNVIVSGTANNRGCRFEVENYSSETGTTAAKLRLTWMKMRYAGYATLTSYAAIGCALSPATPTALLDADALLVQNIVFDTSGSKATGAAPANQASSYGIHINNAVGFSNPLCVQDVYAYDMGRVISVAQCWELELTRIVGISTGYSLVIVSGTTTWGMRLNDVWCSQHDWRFSSASALNGEFEIVDTFEFFACYNCWTGLTSSNTTARTSWVQLKSGKVYHLYGYFTPSSMGNVYMRAVDVEFYTTYTTAFYVPTTSCCDFYFERCSFDNCNTTGGVNQGAVSIYGAAFGEVLFTDCTFGTVARNNYSNVMVGASSASLELQVGRVRAEECIFVEPLSWTSVVGSYLYYNKTCLWSIRHHDGDWRVRTAYGQQLSIELTDCSVLTSALVDQWAADYPGVTEIAIVGGGGEMCDETSVVIDSTFARKLLPFHTVDPMPANMHNPVKIPVVSGQVVTAKLSMRKTNDGVCALPGIRLEGPGIFSESLTTAALLNSWEELTVTGTASADGVCYLYVHAGTNNAYGNASNHPTVAPAFGPPPAASMFDCTVYADGLDIAVV